ncbi:GNAT family N-acetyltransferase [Luteococcus sp. OSA5]|uniref:GNAT family N-acetyltransferase n=1 Tax=Luteococcus sp. OSA5 TaxID=3401630 RepID=UPI003B432B9F
MADPQTEQPSPGTETVAEPVEAPSFEIRPATPEDAPFMVQCHIECLAETYAHIMPPAFAQMRRDRFRQEVQETLDELLEMQQALTAGRAPIRSHWLAVADDGPLAGEVLGAVASGEGMAPWERVYFSNPEPPVSFNLDHLYTRAVAHGSGMGQALLDVALAAPSGGGRAAWLWILRDNPRAEAFYRRNGFVPDGLEVGCGPSWFDRPMFRMWRPSQP